MNVYYLGPTGSYSHVAAKQMYNNAIYKLVALDNFAQIYAKVSSESESLGILPIENSITSDVHENVDMLFKGNLHIVAEANLLINLHLMSAKGAKIEDIAEVYSHPKALAQTTEFTGKHNMQTHELDSTAAAAQQVLSDNSSPITKAFIGGKALLTENAVILANNIGNSAHNITRFVVVGHALVKSDALVKHNALVKRDALVKHDTLVKPEYDMRQTETVKITLKFKTKHQPGSLANVLTAISALGVNLTKIESRPIPGTDWEYDFWVDLVTGSDNLAQLEQTVKQSTLEYKVIGVYAPGGVFES